MPYQRDPLSRRYDGQSRQVLVRAIRASYSNRGVRAWIASTRAELRNRDEGGRTAHERAFSRSAYYLVFRTPLRYGRVPDWSLKLTWGSDAELRASAGGRLARPVTVRVWPRSQARVRAAKWTEDVRLQSGGVGSPKRRFDGAE